MAEFSALKGVSGNPRHAWRLAVVLLILPALGMPRAWGQLAPLQDGNCELPSELKGVTGHALFRYVVGEDGKVHEVTELYSNTDPAASQLAFTASLSQCLKTWRYQPAAYGRMLVPVQLLIAFHYFQQAPAGAPVLRITESRSIPRVHLDLMRKERIRLASRLLKGQDFQEIRKPGWAVLTNVTPDQRTLLVEAIERAQLAFNDVFPGAPPLPDSSALTVFLFRNEDEFNQVAAFDNLLRFQGGIAGQYSPYEQTAYASLGDKPQRIAISELVHEVTHHLVHQRLFQDGREPPKWVNEGIATFLELLPEGSHADLSRFARGRQSEGDYRWNGRGGSYLNILSREARSGDEPDLKTFLTGSAGPQRGEIAYGLSWLLVHFFITGEQQAYREKFQNWLLTAADARQGDSVLSAVGLTIEDLQRALSKHRKRLQSSAY